MALSDSNSPSHFFAPCSPSNTSGRVSVMWGIPCMKTPRKYLEKIVVCHSIWQPYHKLGRSAPQRFRIVRRVENLRTSDREGFDDESYYCMDSPVREIPRTYRLRLPDQVQATLSLWQAPSGPLLRLTNRKIGFVGHYFWPRICDFLACIQSR